MSGRSRVRPTYTTTMSLLLTDANGTRLDPVVAGVSAQSTEGWRWIFYLIIIASGGTIPVNLILLPRKLPRFNNSMWDLLTTIDFLGFVLFAGTFAFGTMVLSSAGSQYAWSSSQTVGLLCCSGRLWIYFAAHCSLSRCSRRDLKLNNS